MTVVLRLDQSLNVSEGLSVFTFDWVNVATRSNHDKAPGYSDLGLKTLKQVFICERYTFVLQNQGW